MADAPRSIALSVNGIAVAVAPGTTVAAAVLLASQATRISVCGEPRGPICGMGICFECRVTIDGVPHQRSCQMLCAQGMQIATDEATHDSGKARHSGGSRT